MTPDPRIQEIEERLEKATPGPWVSATRHPLHEAPYVGAVGSLSAGSVYVAITSDDDAGQGVRDAQFIASAPDDLRYLLSERARLIKELEEQQAQNGAIRTALRDIVEDLEARWDMSDPRTNPGIKDNVRQARAALTPHLE